MSRRGQGRHLRAYVSAMRIRDITLAEVRAGKNWRFVAPDDDRWFHAPMEDWGPLLAAGDFEPDDHVVYSALMAYESGRTEPLLMVKRVGDLDYGGEYCEYVDGKWRQVGLVPDPDVEFGDEFIADPLGIDESFSEDEYRQQHREGFLKHAGKLPT